MKKIFNLILIATMLLINISFAANTENVNRVMNSVDKTTESVSSLGKATTSGVKTVYEDSKTLLNTAHDDAKSLSQYLGIRLDSLSAKSYKIAGKGLGNLWDIIVKQQRVIAITLLILWILSLVSLIRLSIVFNTTPINEMNNVVCILRVIWLTCSIAGVIMGILNSVDIFTGLMNPEYGALREITLMLQQTLH